jgi:hypothetical protein
VPAAVSPAQSNRHRTAAGPSHRRAQPLLVPMVQKKYAPAEGTPTHTRRMSLMSETLARGALTGTAFPPVATCPDFPLAAFFYLDQVPSDAELTHTMRKIADFARLKSRVVPDTSRKKHNYVWEEVVDIEQTLMQHVTRTEVGSETELREAMDNLLVAPLETTRPLWDVCVLTLKADAPWTPSKGGPKKKPPIVCVRVSHAVGDGLSLVNVMNHLTDGESGVLEFKRRVPTRTNCVMSYMTNPVKILDLFVWLFNCVYAVLAAIATPVGKRDSHTAFYDAKEVVAFSGNRKMITCDGFLLSDLREIKNKFTCTINDVVCACLAGALRRYDETIAARNTASQKKSNFSKNPYTRAAIAVPFVDGRPKDPAFLCNNWTFVSLVLASGPSLTIVERLRLTKVRPWGFPESRLPVYCSVWSTVGKYYPLRLPFPIPHTHHDRLTLSFLHLRSGATS